MMNIDTLCMLCKFTRFFIICGFYFILFFRTMFQTPRVSSCLDSYQAGCVAGPALGPICLSMIVVAVVSYRRRKHRCSHIVIVKYQDTVG